MHVTLVAVGSALCVAADILMNSMNAGHFATGEGTEYLVSYWAFVLIAVSFAVNGPLISFFGDPRAINVAFFASALSAALSVTSVYTATVMKAEYATQVMRERERIEENLRDKDKKIAACRADRYCVSEEMRARMLGYEQELAALPKNVVAVDQSGFWYKFGLAVKLMIALFLPFVSAELCRQLGYLTGGPRIAKRGSTVVPERSDGSQTRNSESSAPPSKAKRGTQARIPTDDEHEQIRAAYQALKREGHDKITVEALRLKARKSKSMVGWWLRNTDEETRMAGYEYGKNIVPIGQVVKG